MSTTGNDKHVFNAAEQAGQWTDVHLAPLLLRLWHRGWNFLNHNTNFRQARDCQSIAGFLLENNLRPRAGTERKKNMNTNNRDRRVPTRFGPETRFEVKPVPPAPFRAIEETELERLKNRLLLRTLAELGEPGVNTFVRRAANEAAALAWVTLYPLLTFPGLFEEKTAAALLYAKRQESVRERSPELVLV